MSTTNTRAVARARSLAAVCRRCPGQRGRLLRAFALLAGIWRRRAAAAAKPE